MLNEQFHSVFTSESDDPIPYKGTSKHLSIPPLTISTPDIKKLLNNIIRHKATCPDNISGQVLKDLEEQTAPILNLIFTTSFHTGQTPTDWKTSNVAPAFKKGEKHKAINYRPFAVS